MIQGAFESMRLDEK